MKAEPKKKKTAIGILLGISIVSVAVAVAAHLTLFAKFDLEEPVYIYIGTGKNFEDVVTQLKTKAGLPSEKTFRLLADKMKYPENIKTGRYAITGKMNMIDAVRNLRSGRQTPVEITFNNIRTKENLAARLSQQLMMDSLELLDALNDPHTARKLGFDDNTLAAMFIPNTYEVYWDTGIDRFLDRMKREYDSFWNETRKNKARNIGLTPVEVSTLASIVEEEAFYADEYPVIAGLYLNRLKKGMKLEADPTVKFAAGDFSLKRILYRHLEIESPYNTYKNMGLPPGPIRIPSISAIDATLSPQESNYLFMAAKEDFSGRHNFAATFAEHARNAAKYQQALNRRGIY